MPMSTTSTTPDVLMQLNELLNGEKWTRATLNNYTVANFEDLDTIIEQMAAEGLEDDARLMYEEHLQHTKNSIIALYISGVIDIANQAVDDANLITLTQIFYDNHKWNIVEHLCNRILGYGENRSSLRILADVYDSENEPEKLHQVWERLIRVDYEEADIVRQLAELREKGGQQDEAVAYYKKALHRYISKKNFSHVKDIWHRLVELAPGETEFFYHAEQKIARSISTERSVQLLEELYPSMKNSEEWDRAIVLLKRVLAYDPKNHWARKEIVECFEHKFADHSNLDEYIRVSNISQSWRPVQEAIADFEKHIAFDTGNFVFHRSWGIGRIRNIESDTILIDFAQKRNHSMSLKMAVDSLEVLPKEHIWVLRAVWKKEKLKALVKKNIVWTLKTVIRSIGDGADMKKIKAELVPSILTQGEWSSWSVKAREILKTNPDFGILESKADHYTVRTEPVTYEEKTYNRFRSENTFFDRVKTLEDYLEYLRTEQVENRGEHIEGLDSDYVREMVDYFVTLLRTSSQINEQTVSSALVLQGIFKNHPFLKPVDFEVDTANLYAGIDNLEELFLRIDLLSLRKRFLEMVRAVDRKNWGAVYERLLPYHRSREVLLDLTRHGKGDIVERFVQRVHENYRSMRETFVWLVRSCGDDPWLDAVGITSERRLLALLHLYDLTFRDIENRKEVSLNRKINKQIQAHLFRDGALSAFLDTADEDSVGRVYALMADITYLEARLVLDIKQRIVLRFPQFRFYGEDAAAASAEVFSAKKMLYCTETFYEAKKSEYNHLQQVEVPQNSKEIEAAREYGDLKENAEYKAAMERQDNLNNRAAKLKGELEIARVVTPQEVNTDEVFFGTRVELWDRAAEKTITYTILGPWESDPDNSIISYQSPLGNRLLRHKVGDQLDFVINEKQYQLEIRSIEVGDFS